MLLIDRQFTHTNTFGVMNINTRHAYLHNNSLFLNPKHTHAYIYTTIVVMHSSTHSLCAYCTYMEKGRERE